MVAYAARGVRNEIAGAVIPEGDMIEVFDVQRTLDCRTGGSIQTSCSIDKVGHARRESDVGWVHGDVAGVRSEEIEVVKGVVVFVGAAEAYYDQAD